MCYEIFLPCLVKHQLFQVLCECWRKFCLLFWVVHSPVLGSFFTHMCWLGKDLLQISSALSLSRSSLSPGNTDHLVCPELPTPFSHLKDSSGIHAGVWKLTPGDKQTGATIGLISLFPLSQELLPYIASCSMSENHCFLYFFSLFVVSEEKENLGPVTPIWLKAEVSIYLWWCQI